MSKTVRYWVNGSALQTMYASRRKADAYARKCGTWVVERTIVDRDLTGLRWEHENWALCWVLYDGDTVEAFVDVEDGKWCIRDRDNARCAGPFDTLAEAKAAAEALVREAWT